MGRQQGYKEASTFLCHGAKKKAAPARKPKEHNKGEEEGKREVAERGGPGIGEKRNNKYLSMKARKIRRQGGTRLAGGEIDILELNSDGKPAGRMVGDPREAMPRD